MLSAFYRSVLATILLALLLCGFYPLAVTGVAKAFFKEKSAGGLIVKDGKVVGAALIGQNFSDPRYFHGRPSATGNNPYDAANSMGSNLGPTNQKLMEGIRANIQTVLKENPGIQANQIPVDLVTASGSGLDPHLSPEAAQLQAERIAQTRKLSVDRVKALIQAQTRGPQWGVFGEPSVNVLQLNLALDGVR